MITVGDVSTTNILKRTNVSYNVNNSSGDGSPALSVTDNYSSNQFYFIPNNGSGDWSPLVLPNNLTIIGRGANQNNATLVLATYSNLKTGIRLTSTASIPSQTELWAGNNTSIILNNTTGISLTGDSSFNSNVDISGNLSVKKGSVRYSTTYSTSGSTLNNNSTYSNTFDGTSLTCTLPSVTSANVGIQFLITNVNSNSLSVIANNQSIYSSGSSATSRTLLQYESRIFTAIQTNTTIYGWSMV